MNITKVIKVDLTTDELAAIRATHDIVVEICEAAEGNCDICPLQDCCPAPRDSYSGLRPRLRTLYLTFIPEDK